VPYVNHFGETPEKGWPEFWDSPRYSSGYASLWHTFAFVPETHMLKPYRERVQATRALMESFIEFAGSKGREITAVRESAEKNHAAQSSYPLGWKWEPTKSTEITFKGYEAGYKTSDVSGLPRLFYDRNKPYEKQIPFYNTYTDTFSVHSPTAYLIPQGWWKVIERLQANGIPMQRLTSDTAMGVEVYKIESYQSSARPYEGHHPNTEVQVSTSTKKVRFRKGDYLVPLTARNARFLVEVLEPRGEDSYFAWNFFDTILGQKEGFSDYVFEDTAVELLKRDQELKKKLEERSTTDTAFAKNRFAQLNFVYQNSPYYEPSHMEYPVYRLTVGAAGARKTKN
jgi:hypothetical protein